MTTTTQTPAAVVNSTPAVIASKGVATPKAPKAPKASPPKAAKASKSKASSLLVFEPGLHDIALADIDSNPEGNVTRPEWVAEVANAKAIEANLSEIKAQLQALGQLEAIIVQRVKGGKQPYRLAAGYRRTLAMTQLGHKTISARIEATGTDEARVLVNIVENENSKRSTTALGKLAAAEQLAAQGNTVAEVAVLMGSAEDIIRDLLRINSGAAEVRAALALSENDEGSVSWGVARQVLRFSKGEQAQLLKRVGHLSVEAARSYLAEYRAAKKAEAEGDEGEGEGEGEGETSSKKATKEDAVYPEARVVKATIPFLVKMNGVAFDLDAAVKEMAAATLALDAAGIGKAQKSIEKALASLIGAGEKQFGLLETLLGMKEVKAFMKAEQA